MRGKGRRAHLPPTATRRAVRLTTVTGSRYQPQSSGLGTTHPTVTSASPLHPPPPTTR